MVHWATHSTAPKFTLKEFALAGEYRSTGRCYENISLGHLYFRPMVSYIYALLDPRGKMLAYVGRAVDPEARYFDHIRCDGSNKGKDKWIQDLKASSMLPILYIFEQTDRKYESIRERFWIDEVFGFGYQLYNIASVYPRERLIFENKMEMSSSQKLQIETKKRLEVEKQRRKDFKKLCADTLKETKGVYNPFDAQTLEILASIRARHEKKRQAQIEEQVQAAKSWARQKKVLLLLCFGGIAWVAHFIYQAYLITNPF